MFFKSNNFKTLEAGVEMSWMKQQLHTQNIANIETPGYKSKDLVFSKVLEDAQSSSSKGSVASINARVVTNDSLSLLQDGNNVSLEKENLELYKSYTQYSLLLDKITGQFDNYNYVLNNNMK